MTLTVDGTLYFYFLSHTSYSMNKLKSHMLFTYKNLMFCDFTKKKYFAQTNGGGAGAPLCHPFPYGPEYIHIYIYIYIYMYIAF